ncbi:MULTISPECIES: hypothetical protein [Cryobacterium]|uniref:Uncharacterized protein n=1 Tax=Cryobacterium breve TaxID=1259258 RepID=A0ABY2J004_9MICO|nr:MULTISPECIES: hypothetical protein [Cryobacterium]TFC91737.1 hypothetical protein E3T20_12800 [Cryobacterium sp. TmT3-12]TFC98286.1 hypothetical protein E3O65_08020 [Cryobacterium breve]
MKKNAGEPVQVEDGSLAGARALVSGTLNHLSASRRRPTLSASFIAGTKPAEDTGFGVIDDVRHDAGGV